jgi:hypothetical protein
VHASGTSLVPDLRAKADYHPSPKRVLGPIEPLDDRVDRIVSPDMLADFFAKVRVGQTWERRRTGGDADRGLVVATTTDERIQGVTFMMKNSLTFINVGELFYEWDFIPSESSHEPTDKTEK